MSMFDERNLSMMMDLYEMTMSNGYLHEACGHDRATFDVFFRKVPDNGGYAIFAGLEQVVDFIEHMHLATDGIGHAHLRKDGSASPHTSPYVCYNQ